MKLLIFVSLMSLTAVQAQASPRSLNLNCDGRELAVNGRRGAVSIQAATEGLYTYGSPWSLALTMAGRILAAEGIACGEARWDNATAYTHYPFETKLVLDTSGTHGRFYCIDQNKNIVRLELTNCH